MEEAIRSGLKFRAVFFSKSAENKSERLLPQLAAHVETLLLPDKLFASAVPSDTPQGVAALVKCRQFTLSDILSRLTRIRLPQLQRRDRSSLSQRGNS